MRSVCTLFSYIIFYFFFTCPFSYPIPPKSMHDLPDEILLRTFKLLATNYWQLLQLGSVCRKFKRISDDARLWYNVFQSNFPVWGRHVQFAANPHSLIDWKRFVLHVEAQRKRARSINFSFVPDERSIENMKRLDTGRKRKLRERSPPSLSRNICRQRTSSTTALDSEWPFPSNGLSSLTSASSITIPNENGDPFSPPSTLDRWMQSERVWLPTVRPEPVFDRTSILMNSSELPFRIQDPLVVDIDRKTNVGIVATGKHRKETTHYMHTHFRSEHKILFWEYPSWRLVREFDLSLAPPEMTCQIVGIQSIRVLCGDGQTTQKIRLFALAIGQPLGHVHLDVEGAEDRVDHWQAVLIYRLFDDGTTQCLAHLRVEGHFIGREVFFFSDISWGQSNDGQWDPDDNVDAVRDWMEILTPSYANYDRRHTIFMLAIGSTTPRFSGCAQLAQFDIRGDPHVLDPSMAPLTWNRATHRFMTHKDNLDQHLREPLSLFNKVIAVIPLGDKVSCMVHFRYPPHLNHLICTGSFQDEELSVFDWRFGVKVGTLPWTAPPELRSLNNIQGPMVVGSSDANENPTLTPAAPTAASAPAPAREAVPAVTDNPTQASDEEQAPVDLEMEMDDAEFGIDDEDDDFEPIRDVRPWGFETTMVLPPTWSNSKLGPKELAKHGFRLIAVGDNRRNKLEIKVWDISYLLEMEWDPLKREDNEDSVDEEETDYTSQFGWWKRGTKRLKRVALRMIEEHMEELSLVGWVPVSHLRRRNSRAVETETELPLSPPKGTRPMIFAHSFNSSLASDPLMMPVKYAAYNVLYTSLFLLTDEGEVTVLDIETGKVIGTVDNVAASPDPIGPQQQVRGIDVNVIAGREIVVTSREGLLRSVMT
ncbi:uncharacterized protein BYT42DRAFT_238006 [Radiomyces spectabilis]|uniref:uncharacterized protein n=1 Tax=Radiomyces spectabilis TaxID=64574 RepID=UPI0022202B20|nr:uncharacterized protein BYT42DRAFT_238006 [Radiomyces spectabilis]KAI8388523.1 hypothetical protein BYT42DRAFT_238006 [Radiomyces spectabilis]